MKKITFLLSLFLLGSCTNEYLEYHSKELGFVSPQSIKVEAPFSFKTENIGHRDFELAITPDKRHLDNLVSKIDSSKNRVYLEVYILTEKRIIKSLKDAKSRGVDVRVILEKNVFGAGNMNKKSFESLASSGVKVSYADNKDYRFTHAKFFIIDDTYVISSGNMSYSTFATNKDILLYGNDKVDLVTLLNLFSKDEAKEKYLKCTNSLVISPKCPRDAFAKALKSANKSIYIYAETFDDPEIENILKEKSQSKVDIKILLGDVTKISSNKDSIVRFKKSGIDIKAIKKPYIHAKMFIVDNKIAYIGSINFSTNSIENNREIGVIFSNADIMDKIKNEFLTNFTNKQ